MMRLPDSQSIQAIHSPATTRPMSTSGIANTMAKSRSTVAAYSQRGA